jgi:uncharacterized OB-fold protein
VPPIPRPSPDTAPYWNAARAGELHLQRCRPCDRLVWYPRVRCHRCGSDDLRWEALSGDGSVHAFTIVHRAADPDLADALPYVVALIELAEGARLMSNIVDIHPDAIRIGMPVRVRVRELEGDILLPVFGPAE